MALLAYHYSFFGPDIIIQIAFLLHS